jgi:hypothetical protein
VTDSLTEKIIGAAIEVHKALGPGLLESIYEEALCVEFEIREMHFDRQVGIEVFYKGRAIKGQRIDIIAAASNDRDQVTHPNAKCGYGSGIILFESDRIKAWLANQLWRKPPGRRN